MTKFPIAGGQALRFATDKGVVWVIVKEGEYGTASLAVYEQECALGMIGKPDSEIPASASNRFGTGRMLKILREVRVTFPDVTLWYMDRVAGAMHGERMRR